MECGLLGRQDSICLRRVVCGRRWYLNSDTTLNTGEVGLVQPGVVWVLTKALYGLRAAPDGWCHKHGDTLEGHGQPWCDDITHGALCHTPRGMDDQVWY